MSTLHHYRRDRYRTARRIPFRATAVLLALAWAAPAWGDCPETLTLAEMVDCFGAQGEDVRGGTEGTPPEPPQVKGSEDATPDPPAEPSPTTDVDC